MLTNCKAEFSNPHAKCVRELLNWLRISVNEYESLNIELRNVQKELKEKIDNVIFQCSERRKLDCASEERLNEFQKDVENIDAISECFKKRIEDIQKKRQKIVEESKNYFDKLDIEKKKLNQFHHKTINYLKAFAVHSNDPVTVRACEKDVNEVNKEYAKEVSYIKKCENILSPLFLLLHEGKAQEGECNGCKEYDWAPPRKSLEIVNSIANDIKNFMGVALRKAFAHLYIHRGDGESFLAEYLMTIERNEEIIKEKMDRFRIP